MKITSSFAATVLLGWSSGAFGQGPKTTLESGLEARYALTTATADYSDIVTGGAVLTLMKKGLLASDATARGACINSYKGGQIKPTASCQMMGGKVVLGTHIGGTATTRTFVNGEKLFVTRIDVDRNKDTVSLDLFSDAYNNVRFRAILRFEFAKGFLAADDLAKVQTIVSEAVSATPPEAPAAAPQPPVSRRPLPSVAPDPAPVSAPPPPQTSIQPDAPPLPPVPDPISVGVGDTAGQIVSKLGPPQKVLKAGNGREVYIYKDLKITLVNGKMTDAQ